MSVLLANRVETGKKSLNKNTLKNHKNVRRLSSRTYNDFESRRFTVTVNKEKNDTKESHLLNFLYFKMPSWEMFPLLFMGVEMPFSVLKMYLNSQLKLPCKVIDF